MLLSLMILLFVWTAASTGCRAGRAESQYWWGRASKEEPELRLSIRKKGIRGREQDQRGPSRISGLSGLSYPSEWPLVREVKGTRAQWEFIASKMFCSDVFASPSCSGLKQANSLLTRSSSIAITQLTLEKDYFLFFPTSPIFSSEKFSHFNANKISWGGERRWRENR